MLPSNYLRFIQFCLIAFICHQSCAYDALYYHLARNDTSKVYAPPAELPVTFPSSDFDFDGEIHDQEDLEYHLGGSLEGRKFVVLEKLISGKNVEISHVFRTKRGPKDRLDADMKKNLTDVPSGFNSTTVYIRYTHQLSPLERKADTAAKLGDQCRSTTTLEPDYCERAAYPNKGKMACNTVNETRFGLIPNRCTCKYYRVDGKDPRFRKLNKHKLNFNEHEIDACLSPRNGVCHHRISTGVIDLTGKFIYEVDVCQGHFQCDNTQYLKGNVLTVSRHCTEEEFLSNFPVKNRDDVLLCSKPHPRKFENYDEYKYYCLPKSFRDPEQAGFKPPEGQNLDEDEDIYGS